MSAIHRRNRPPLSFWIKAGAAALLVALADLLFFGREPGGSLGVFALAWTLATVAVHPAIRRDRRALLAAGIAACFAGLQIESPNPLGWLLFMAALGVAALSCRAGPADDAWRWLQRLAYQAIVGLFGGLIDSLKLLKRRKVRSRPRRLLALLPLLTLPVVGGAVFLGLFAAANPVIADILAQLRLPRIDAGRVIFWGVILVVTWATLRPRFQRKPLALPTKTDDSLPIGVSVASVTLSLLVFNVLFALQNGLDIAFLWSGAPLPDGVTLAEYAHRGAYPLIATALLAGLFVLVALRPGTATAKAPLIRWLVVLWVLQNLFLVASSILRTVDYIEVFSLTRFRIAALLWMALVGLGLVLICWRMLRAKSASWLINANAFAALIVLAGISVVDLGAVAAAWNVRHAREVGGRGSALDLCYLNRLGPSAAVSLVELEQQSLSPELRDRVAWVRGQATDDLRRDQDDWRGWTWRAQRRLDRIAALTAGRPAAPPPTAGDRDHCDGQLKPPAVEVAPLPPPAVSAPAPLPEPSTPQTPSAPLTSTSEP